MNTALRFGYDKAAMSDGKGIDLIDSPTDWESKLGDTIPNWLMFVMLQRLVEKIEK